MTDVRGYHAHVYCDDASRGTAERLRETLVNSFPVEPGGFSDDPVGPHPVSQFNVKFDIAQFGTVVPWLMFHREGLDVLVHPLTDNMYDDHSDNALWLGTPITLKLDGMKQRQYRAELLLSGAAPAA